MNDQLNFLHINASDIRWGASLSAYRLHKALLESGYGSHIYCGLKESSGRDVTSIVPGRYGYIPNALVGKFFNLLGLQSFGYPSSFFIKNFALFGEWADITVIKNIHWWYFSMDVLPWISEKTPIIWRLTDMWPFTGHCAFSYECSRWQTGCGNCPHLSDYPKLYIDTTNFLWKRKKKIFESLKGKLTFVAPSNWLKNIAENSPLTKDFPCDYIPTAVDLAVFKPIDKSTARHVLGINEEDKVIMFSSFKLSEKRKGGLEFVEVIKSLSEQTDFPITVLLVGGGDFSFSFPPNIKVVKVGFIGDDRLLSLCYGVSDVYLSMSKADNLPNTLIEALACGTPIITLDSGGCRDAVVSEETGYVASNSQEVISSLKELLTDNSKSTDFSKRSRTLAQKRFSMEAQVESYAALAQKIKGN